MLHNKEIYYLRKNKFQTVFHALTVERAVNILKNNKIQGFTHQRIWPDGIRRKNNDPEYNNSYTIKGISTTRDFNFAYIWGDVILILNLDDIKRSKKVIPYSWNYSDRYCSNYKKEKEEFIQLAIIKHSFQVKHNKDWIEEFKHLKKSKKEHEKEDYDYLYNFYLQEGEKYDVAELKKPYGELDLNKCLSGFFVRKTSQEHNHLKEGVSFLSNHPLFKGFI
jgi:hypothetical protein